LKIRSRAPLVEISNSVEDNKLLLVEIYLLSELYSQENGKVKHACICSVIIEDW
jgi:hypothetical protein